jgi:hypothetical protein
MNVNISYFLEGHGWSTCWIYANGKHHEISITHIFKEDPIEECLNSLIGIIKGEKERKFIWYGEPGGELISINENDINKGFLNFKVESFNGDYQREMHDIEVSIEFEIKKKQLVRMFYFEFKKICELMKDIDYSNNRKNEFPFSRFLEFEKIVMEYLYLKK